VEVRGTTLGAHLLTPLLRDGHAPLLVDPGWVRWSATGRWTARRARLP
jgi:surfeit locus 1 family protein